MKDRKQGGKGGSLEKTLKLFKIYYYTPGKEKLKKKTKKPHLNKKTPTNPNPTDSVAVSTICLQAGVFS